MAEIFGVMMPEMRAWKFGTGWGASIWCWRFFSMFPLSNWSMNLVLASMNWSIFYNRSLFWVIFHRPGSEPKTTVNSTNVTSHHTNILFTLFTHICYKLTPKTNPSTAFFDWNDASPSLRFSLSTSSLFDSYIKGNKSLKITDTNWFDFVFTTISNCLLLTLRSAWQLRNFEYFMTVNLSLMKRTNWLKNTRKNFSRHVLRRKINFKNNFKSKNYF